MVPKRLDDPEVEGLLHGGAMKAPKVYIVVQTAGDGYGHNSYTYLSWHFDESEARARVEILKLEVTKFGFWFDFEEVPAFEPMNEDRW